MKPHIRRWMGIWHCYVLGPSPLLCGLGWTPSDAFTDWKALMNKTDAGAVPSSVTT